MVGKRLLLLWGSLALERVGGHTFIVQPNKPSGVPICPFVESQCMFTLWSRTTALFWCVCGSLYKFPGDVINVQLVRILLSLVAFYGMSIQGDTASPIYFTLWAYRDLVVQPLFTFLLCVVWSYRCEHTGWCCLSPLYFALWAYRVTLPLPSILYTLAYKVQPSVWAYWIVKPLPSSVHVELAQYRCPLIFFSRHLVHKVVATTSLLEQYQLFFCLVCFLHTYAWTTKFLWFWLRQFEDWGQFDLNIILDTGN